MGIGRSERPSNRPVRVLKWFLLPASVSIAVAAGEGGKSLARVAVSDRVQVCAGGHAPKLARVSSRRFLVAARTGLRGIGRNSSISLVESEDGGRSWSAPRLLHDSPKDDRVQALSLLPDGSLLLAFIEEKGGRADCFIVRSRDQGRTWSKPEPLDPSPFDYAYPYGRVILGDAGELLMTAYGGYYPLYRNEGKPPEKQGFSSFFFGSWDGGKSWKYARTIARQTSQPSVIRLSSGKLLAALRSAKVFTDVRYRELMKSPTEYVKVPDEILMSESPDNGKTWSAARKLSKPGELQGYLLELSFGAVVMTYSVRHAPYGVSARLSEDEGRSWSPPISLISDAPSPDVGLTQTIETQPGRLMTLYYTEDTAKREAHVYAVFWSLIQ